MKWSFGSFETQTDHRIPARRQDQTLIVKKISICYLVDYISSGRSQGENKSNRKNKQILRPCLGTEKKRET